MRRGVGGALFSIVIATYLPVCTLVVRPTAPLQTAPHESLWEPPADLGDRDLFAGEWGAERAPDAGATYRLLERKHSGSNPGLIVRDPRGRRWSVKQAPTSGRPSEGPIEVIVSRVLSAVGYHQPPVYYLPSFTLADDWGLHREPGGRFRLHDKSLKEVGEWSWQQNPFVGTRPYQGLLVILLMFNSSDLKNTNNSVYEYRANGGVERWFVVRDLGTALGETGRIAPRRGDPVSFASSRFVTGVRDGFVAFDYHGWHQELVRRRITPDDVGWAGDLLAGLSEAQWGAAFRAGGYPPAQADRFIAKLRLNVARARKIGAATAVRITAVGDE